MNQKKLTIILLVFIAVSCSDPGDPATELLVWDLSQDLTVKSDMTLSQIAHGISYTKLESKPGCFIGKIRKYSVTDDYILIFEWDRSQIMLFNRKGEFLRNISRSGKGPGEFIFPRDVRISKDEKYILILTTNKVLRYAYNGEFIGETTTIGHAKIVDTFDDGLVAFYTSYNCAGVDGYSIIFYDWEGNVTGRTGKRNWDRLQRGYSVHQPSFYFLEDELRIHEHYYDTVYAVTGNKELEPRIRIIRNHDYDNFRMPRDWKEMTDFGIDKWMETPDYIFTTGGLKHFLHPLCLDKMSGKIYHIPYNKELNSYGIPNDMDGGPPFWPSRYKDGKIISIKYASQIKSILDNELIDKAEFRNQKLREKLMDFRENLKEDDGPIIVEISLK